MRNDGIGFFWSDVTDRHKRKLNTLEKNNWTETSPGYFTDGKIILSLDEAYSYVKANASQYDKIQPPEPFWLDDNYIPQFEKHYVETFTDEELVESANTILTFDIECYSNYLLIAFYSPSANRIVYFELTPEVSFNRAKLNWIIQNFCIVGFNSNYYDIPIMTLALAGHKNNILQQATDDIIINNMWAQEVLKKYGVTALENINSIDLINVAPLKASLKIYGGRIHSKTIQDLPYSPNIELNFQQKQIILWYCINDLLVTYDLYKTLKEEIKIRESLTKDTQIDLRSKSDAQIAETIITENIKTLAGWQYIKKVKLKIGKVHRYKTPRFIQFQTQYMKDVLSFIEATEFVVNDKGKIDMPEKMELKINETKYQLGIGGLHSKENNIMHYSDHNYTIYDYDVTSYYPSIILNLGLYPKHLDVNFLQAYKTIVRQRIKAKNENNKILSDMLKIVINGSFGKFGNIYSNLYAPELVIQTTITGQLSLLFLIETLELEGISVVSANTDGIVIKCPKSKIRRMESLVSMWEKHTGFTMERNKYIVLLSRDVNNYIALKENKSIKSKGAFAYSGLSKNPVNEICIEAIERLLIKYTPVECTIRNSDDISKFVSVRTVKGGAVKDNVYLGKAIRWYYSTDCEGYIIYANSGNRVPKTLNAKPVMSLPNTLPSDVDFNFYINETESILKDCGYYAN